MCICELVYAEKCVLMPYDTPWAVVQKYSGGWIHVSQRIHVLALTLTGWQLLGDRAEMTGGLELAGDQIGRQKNPPTTFLLHSPVELFPSRYAVLVCILLFPCMD